ncbi:hypothetical protein [Streptomyces sp. FIT100]|uniref:hypothetical protein n=1 Tax=Streptomyces sp. FIT100 TaxID=2837956 RepID=UPI0021C827E7|nr:hypothetical protein [Streptomyces sp. FIT100]UUN25437.1 hypothetical protein KK483_02645 [Streptomyces sp. FIT100]
MPKPKREKPNHLIYAEVVGSEPRVSVWMDERASFRERQGCSLDALQDRTEWAEVKFGDEFAACYGVARVRRTETKRVVAQ